MAQITAALIRVYKATGPAKEERKIVLGPVRASALDTLDRYDGSGSAFYFKMGLPLDQDEWLVITAYHATSAVVAASTLLMVNGVMNYKGVDGGNKSIPWTLTEGTTGITKSASIAAVETEIVSYQIPRNTSVAIRDGDQFYLYIADA